MTNEQMTTVTLTLNSEQAAMLSHAIAEFQDSFHRLSHEDHMISEQNISDLEKLSMMILSQTKIEPNTLIMPSAFASDEEIEEWNECFHHDQIG
jgi:hypothetical protein